MRLRVELEKAERDKRLMAMIADNYVKEIRRRKGGATEERQTQSANVFSINKKQQQAMLQMQVNGEQVS